LNGEQMEKGRKGKKRQMKWGADERGSSEHMVGGRGEMEVNHMEGRAQGQVEREAYAKGVEGKRAEQREEGADVR
jgi:hypothetical protein